MDVQRRKEMPSVAMVLVIDRSGSMTGLPIEMAKAACQATVSTLQGDDLLEVVAFDSRSVRYVKMQPARYRSRIQNEIMRIQPGGGTEIFPALDMAYQDISVAVVIPVADRDRGALASTIWQGNGSAVSLQE